MARKLVPRPPSASAAGYFLVGVAFFGFVRGTLLVNDALHEALPNETVPYLFSVPLVAGFCAWFVFNGHNWARYFFWIVAGPLAIYGLIVGSALRPVLLMNVLYTLVYLVAGGLLATGNSHWFFTGRDYRRRPVTPAAQSRGDAGGERDKRKFDY